MRQLPYGAEPALEVRKFLNLQTANEKVQVSPHDVQQIMDACCARLKCRKNLSLLPVELPVQLPGGLRDVVSVPLGAKPRDEILRFGNQHRLSVAILQEIMDSLCRQMDCTGYD
eukprot:FR737991.1.p1 GENE.FR737991.1~~FR737991.1.p1  ORF type:complete len:114 (+),score=7.39 FR737991.1:108-449(+)